jgi:hypothetical protein
MPHTVAAASTMPICAAVNPAALPMVPIKVHTALRLI